ncbi:hypothetical protein RND81_14G037000 [Saponaria officinalis]|uniref:Uncharacterized protein n=2 Tax=Saponaria officinalis TaxID=3572 RepID=A0AAW1GS59_SAPOF
MAEAIILPIANSILHKIASLTGDSVVKVVGEEIGAFRSVKEDLKAIADDLESITAVLADADAKQYSNAAINIWVRDLKSVVYDIDDLLDDVATDALQRSVNKGHFFPQLRYYLSLTPLFLRIDLSHKIKDLRLQLERVTAKKNKYGLTDRPVEVPSVQRNIFDTSCYVNELAIVGRDEAKNDLISRALGLSDECSLSVLPILGMGGIGKTALAKLVYSNVDQFDIKLWVCISDKFDIQKILQDILKDATHENTSNYSFGELVEKVQTVLNGKKFFLVLDDLWEDDIRLWIELKDVLAVGGRGSVILITTRIEKVASITQTVEPYHLDKLSDSVCWFLFKNLAFKDGEEKMYPRLGEIGKSIVSKCCGNPLVVRSLGSLLRSERDEGEWVRVMNMDNLNQLDGQYSTVKQLLKLSYDKLPSHLKPCFAHLSLFAKDNGYSADYLFYCWSALGLLRLCDGSCLEHKILIELLSRSMLQDVTLAFDKEVCTFKIHDLLHDLAGDVLGTELAVVTRSNISAPDSSRYIAWGLGDLSDKEFPEQVKARKARAFVFRYVMRSVSQSFLKGIISEMPCLRVLDLEGSQFEELPSSIGKLKHLRALNLSSNALLRSIPESICKLLNLESLLLVKCIQLKRLPRGIYKLTSLRYFCLTTCQTSLVGTNFNRLPSLQLMVLHSCMRLVSFWDDDDVGRLTSLRKLRIVNCPKLATLPNSMKLLAGLEELLIVNCDELDLERGECLSGLLSLQKLTIVGVPRLSCLPNGLQSVATSLRYLGIKDCGGLAELPNWFQSCVSLQDLRIENCRNLLSLPDGIRHLNSQSLVFHGYHVCQTVCNQWLPHSDI